MDQNPKFSQFQFFNAGAHLSHPLFFFNPARQPRAAYFDTPIPFPTRWAILSQTASTSLSILVNTDQAVTFP